MKTVTALALLLATTSVLAAPEHQRPPGPPPEAFDICKGKKDGDVVELKTPRGDIVKGSCRMVMIPDRK